jgi:hypothetical protein
MILGEALIKLAEKSGTNTNSDEFKAILQATQTIEIDDSIAQSFDNLITVKQAKNNADIKGHFFSQFADSTDVTLLDAFKPFGITDEVYANLKATEPSTFKRINLLSQEAKKLQDSISNAKEGSKKEAELIAQYESKMQEIQNNYNSAIKQNQELVAQHQNERMDWLQTDLIRKNPLNTEIPYVDRIAKMAIEETLKKNGAKPVLINGNIELRQIADESLNFDATYESIVNKALADNKLLKVTQTQQATPQPQTTQAKPTNNFVERLINTAQTLK